MSDDLTARLETLRARTRAGQFNAEYQDAVLGDVVAVLRAERRAREQAEQKQGDAMTLLVLAGRRAEQAEQERDRLRELEKSVMYALKSGCFFPVPEPRKGASVDELVKWGAMRNLHTAIAALSPQDGQP